MSENLTEEQILENIDKLLVNSENIVGTYYDMFYSPEELDVELTYTNSSGIEETVTVPNRTKCKLSGLTGSTDPNQSSEQAVLNANIGTSYIYVSGTTYIVYIKVSVDGNKWEQLLNSDAIIQHNLNPNAHEGYLAKIAGDPDIVFNVGTPSADSHAVNVGYIGALGDLKTNYNLDLVGSVNEVYDYAKDLENRINGLTNAPVFCVNKGNVDANGNPDLIIDAGAPLYFYDKTPENYADNSANFRTSSNFGDSQNTWAWGNSGAPFGADLGGGLQGYSYGYHPPNYQQSANGAFSENVGYAGKPIVHTFSTPLSSGNYRFNCASNGYTYRLWYVTADEGTLSNPQTVEVPLPTLSRTEWTEVPSVGYIIIPSGRVITQIKAEGTTNAGDWGIGAVHLIEFVENPSYENTLYFKVGQLYDNLNCSDINGNFFVRTNLAPIVIEESITEGTYTIFLPKTADPYLSTGNIYKQPKEPTVSTGDIWVNTAFFPITAHKWNGTAWEDFNDIPIGKVNIDSLGLIGSATTLPYNNREVTIPNGTLPATVIDAYSQGSEWYRIWSNGFIEQGGFVSTTTAITFLAPFKTTNYNVSGTPSTGTVAYSSKTTTGMTITGTNVLWRACGY